MLRASCISRLAELYKSSCIKDDQLKEYKALLIVIVVTYDFGLKLEGP